MIKALHKVNNNKKILTTKVNNFCYNQNPNKIPNRKIKQTNPVHKTKQEGYTINIKDDFRRILYFQVSKTKINNKSNTAPYPYYKKHYIYHII